MNKIVVLVAAVFAMFIAAPANAGGINPMQIAGTVGPTMVRMMGHPQYASPPQRYRQEFRPAQRFERPQVGYGRRIEQRGIPGGYTSGYGGGGSTVTHYHVHTEWFHTQWFRHVEVHHAQERVYVAPEAPVVVERPRIVERTRVVVERPRVAVRHHYVKHHYVARRGCGCCCQCCNCGQTAKVVAPDDPPDDPPEVDVSSIDRSPGSPNADNVPSGIRVHHD